MTVVLNRKRFEATLIKVPFASRMMVCLVLLWLSEREPLSEPRHLAINDGTHNDMPVVGHHAVTEQLNLKLRHCVDEDTFKRLVVRIFLEDRRPTIGAIEHMVNRSHHLF